MLKEETVTSLIALDSQLPKRWEVCGADDLAYVTSDSGSVFDVEDQPTSKFVRNLYLVSILRNALPDLLTRLAELEAANAAKQAVTAKREADLIRIAESLLELTHLPDHQWDDQDRDVQLICGKQLAALAPAPEPSKEM